VLLQHIRSSARNKSGSLSPAQRHVIKPALTSTLGKEMAMSRIGDLKKDRSSPRVYPNISFLNAVDCITRHDDGGEWLSRQIDLGHSEYREDEDEQEAWWLYNSNGDLIARVGRDKDGLVTVLD
jgi:hypothetical protein